MTTNPHQTLSRLLETLQADMAHHEAGAKQSHIPEGRIAHSGMAAGLHVAIIRTLQATGQDQQYVATLASQLQERHPDLLATAEDELALLRAQLALAAQAPDQPEPRQENHT